MRYPHTRRPLLLAALLLALTGSAARPAGAETIEIHAINRDYQALNAPLAPIRQGGFAIAVASPEHLLTVHANRLDFDKVGDRVAVRFEVELEGYGHLIADIEGPNATKTRLEDRVNVRRQKVRVAGEVRLLKAKDGYFMTLVNPLTPTIDIVVESGIADQLISTCRVLEIIPALGALGCNALKSALGTIRVPMPATGTNWKIDASQLTEAERRFFDRYASPL